MEFQLVKSSFWTFGARECFEDEAEVGREVGLGELVEEFDPDKVNAYDVVVVVALVGVPRPVPNEAAIEVGTGDSVEKF